MHFLCAKVLHEGQERNCPVKKTKLQKCNDTNMGRSVTACESSCVTVHEISNNKGFTC